MGVVSGARGLMQVMPETAKAPGFGIKPSDGSQADDVRVGRELLAAHIKQYGGDLGKAWAAYNAGQKWVDAAVARAGKAPPGSREADWFWQLNNDERAQADLPGRPTKAAERVHDLFLRTAREKTDPKTLFDLAHHA